MSQASTEPTNGGQEILNDGFGNRCVICGAYFDEGGICNNGHEKGETYRILPKRRREKLTSFKKPP